MLINGEIKNTVYLYLDNGNLYKMFSECNKLISVYIPSYFYNDIKFTSFDSMF